MNKTERILVQLIFVTYVIYVAQCTVVRLAPSEEDPHGGRLEVFHDGLWGTVCDNNFGGNEATVVCKMLGFSEGQSFCCNWYGEGTGSVWLDNVVCRGNETDIADCEHLGWGVGNCHDHSSDVGVNCYGDVIPPCENAQDDCRTNVPSVDGTLHIEPVITMSSQTGFQQLAFKCVLDPFPSAHLTYWVQWEINGVHIFGAGGGYTYGRDQHPVGGNIAYLQQARWIDQYDLNFNVVCKVTPTFASGSGADGSTIESPSFYAGIEITTPNVEVNDSESALVHFQYTVPFPCLSNAIETQCVQEFAVGMEPDEDGPQCPSGTETNPDYEPFGFPPTVEVPSNQWNQQQTICITGTSEPMRGVKNAKLTLTPIPMRREKKRSPGPAVSPRTPPLNVQVRKNGCALDTSLSTCVSTNDPHMYSFDQRYYELHGSPGEYVMYQHTSYCYSVHAKYYAAGWVMLNCGVAIRAGSEVFVYDNCDRTKGLQTYQSTVTATSCKATKGLEESRDSNGRYNVKFPSGTLVRFDQHFNRIEIVPSCSDKGHTKGLCGTFNGNKVDDFLISTGGFDKRPKNCIEAFTTGQCPTDFTDSWKIGSPANPASSLFGPNPAQDCTCRDRRDVADTCGAPAHTTKCLFNTNQQGHGRKRRSSVPVNPFIGNGTQPADWRNGWGGETATNYCLEKILKSATFNACEPILQDIPDHVTRNIGMCILDIYLTGGIEYADVAVAAMGTACQDQAIVNPHLWNEVAMVTTAVVEDYDCSQDDECDNGQCEPNACGPGVCDLYGNEPTHTCDCSGTDYIGDTCQFMNPCLSTPCENGGTCFSNPDDGSHTCVCFGTGFVGNNCQVADPCKDIPCENGGTCIPNYADQTFTCFCNAYVGETCQFGPSPCLYPVPPCRNGGSCTYDLAEDWYTCNCTEVDFIGSNCQYVDPCLAAPCQNDGTCTADESDGSYTCDCGSSWEGEDCMTEVPATTPTVEVPATNPTTKTPSPTTATRVTTTSTIPITALHVIAQDPDCNSFLVTGLAGVPDAKMTASSEFPLKRYMAPRARLNEIAYTDAFGTYYVGGWSPLTANPGEWIQVEFNALRKVRGVITRGRDGCNPGEICVQYVTSFVVMYSTDCTTWTSTLVYPGNTDSETPVVNMFAEPFYAKCVRINPRTWSGWPSLRFDMIGCDAPVRY